MERSLDLNFEPDAMKFKPVSLDFGKEQEYPYQQGGKKELGFQNLDEAMEAFSNEWSDLVIASHHGNVDQVKKFLDSRIDVNTTGKDGVSALGIASCKGHVKVAGLLLEHGAKVDIENFHGTTPLMIASVCNYAEIASLLLEKGANPNVQNKDGVSALMFAVSQKNIGIVKILLKRGANVDMQDIDGYSSFMEATDSLELTKLLLEHGVQVNLQSRQKICALMVACQRNHYDVVKLLLKKGAQVNLQDNTGQTALLFAAYNGHFKIVKMLLNHGAQVNLKVYENGLSPLMAATHSGYYDMVKIMLQHGAQINMQDTKGNSALDLASFLGHYEIVELLLKHGANPNMRNFNGSSSLLLASFKGQFKVVKLLLDHGAELNMQDFQEHSSLFIACFMGEIKIAEYLLDHGADPNILTKGNFSLAMASRMGLVNLVSLLLKHGASVQDDHSLVYASANGHYEVVKLLLEKGVPVNQPGGTALMAASCAGHCEVVELLLKNGALLNLRDENGNSALTWTAIKNQHKVARILLEKGAEPEIQDLRGITPLHLAACFGYHAMVKLLLDHGAKPNTLDHGGNSPVHITADSNCASLLLSRGGQPCLLTRHDCYSALAIAIGASNYKWVETLLSSTQLENEELCYALSMANHIQDIYITAILYQKCLQVIRRNEALVVDPAFPEVTYWDLTIKRKISSRGTIIRSHSGGISLSIPEQALSPTEEDVDLLIRPCFNIPFELPQGYEPASPAYLIQPSKMVKIQRDITLKIHHYTNLKSKKDCEEMAFLAANPKPVSRGPQSVYLFKETKLSKGIFKPNNQVGEITVQHFCFQMIARKRTSSKLKSGESLYSVRLYRGLSTQDVSAIFCMCLYHPMYLKHCDRMIADQYNAVPYKGMSGRGPVQMLENKITLSVRNSSGWNVVFDKTPTTITKREIDGPKLMKIGANKLNELTNYPPKFSIFAHPSAKHSSLSDPSSPQLVVEGLDIEECCFEIITPYNQRSSSLSSTPSSQSRKSESTVSKLESCSAGKKQTESKNSLSSKDLCRVLAELHSVNTEWKYLGMELGIDYHIIQEIEKKYPNNTKECMAEAVNVWLKTESSTLSWETLCEALRSKLVANPVLAEAIEKKYCTM